jgi:hypothetical protein
MPSLRRELERAEMDALLEKKPPRKTAPRPDDVMTLTDLKICLSETERRLADCRERVDFLTLAAAEFQQETVRLSEAVKARDVAIDHLILALQTIVYEFEVTRNIRDAVDAGKRTLDVTRQLRIDGYSLKPANPAEPPRPAKPPADPTPARRKRGAQTTARRI